MKVLDEIYNRQSIRKFSDIQISDEVIDCLLRAAMNAPSAHNLHPSKSIVIQKRAILDEIPSVLRYGQMMKHASCAILVLGDRKHYHKR